MLGELLGDSVYKETKTSYISRQSKNSRSIDASWRLMALQLFGVFSFLFLFASLVKMQVFAGSYYRDLANNNRVREIPIHSSRGIVFDRNAVALTANIPSFRLVTGLESQTISKDQAIALDSSQKLAADQSLEIDTTRSYLFGKAFGHILGYVSQISAEELKLDGSYLPGDKIGRGGVEEEFENVLRGQTGKELVEVDATGEKLRTISSVPPKSGENITLTIDSDLQKVVYTAIDGKKAAVIVSNPMTGELLALVSSPSFDPNLFTDFSLPITERSAAIDALFTDNAKPLFNRAVSGSYPPGSTFKLVTATAGLETGAITKSTIIEDTGILEIGPYKFPNWKWLAGGGVEGNLDVIGALSKSNDIFFYKTGEMTGIDPLMDWAKKFGLGSKLGVDLPGENSGLVPDFAWRKENTRSWYLGDTYHVAIGQGDLLVTPLQNNTWTNVIANGGKLCKPYLVGNSNCTDLRIRPETISLVRRGMILACTVGGTGYPFFGFTVRNKPIEVACKTGTAEYGPMTSAGLATHGWFTSYAPAQNPEISVTVLIEGGGEGSDVAAPVAKKIYEAWFERKEN